jgi:hypothetical protein
VGVPLSDELTDNGYLTIRQLIFAFARKIGQVRWVSVAKGKVDYRLERGVLVLHIVDLVSLSEMIAVLRRIMADPEIPAGLPALLDVREAAAPPSEDLQQVTDFFADNSAFFYPRRAVLVSSLFQYGVGRIAQAFESMRDASFKVFRDREEAMAFLLKEKG